MRVLSGAAAFVVLMLAGPAALAHYFWIAPNGYRAAPKAMVSLQLRVGHPEDHEPFPRDPSRIRRFIAAHPDGSQSHVAGQSGADPAGQVRLSEPGFHLVAYRSQPAVSVLEAEKFHAYLREEGLERIIALREANGQRTRDGREWFSRSAKALITVSGGAPEAYGSGFDRVLGLQLELVPETNPVKTRSGEPFSVRLLFQGEPAAGVLIRAFSPRSPGAPLERRTDARGRTSFLLGHGGPWLFTGVHIVAAPAGDNWRDGVAVRRPPGDADWESFWASLTLELPAL